MMDIDSVLLLLGGGMVSIYAVIVWRYARRCEVRILRHSFLALISLPFYFFLWAVATSDLMRRNGYSMPILVGWILTFMVGGIPSAMLLPSGSHVEYRWDEVAWGIGILLVPWIIFVVVVIVRLATGSTAPVETLSDEEAEDSSLIDGVPQ